MVGQSEYSLIPIASQLHSYPRPRRNPVWILTLPQLRILQHVKSNKLLRIHALQAQDLDGGPGEAALGRLGRTLHEEDNGRRGNGLVDGGPRLIGEQTGLERGEYSRCGEDAAGGESGCRRARGGARHCLTLGVSCESRAKCEKDHTEKRVLENMVNAFGEVKVESSSSS